ncbi:MAG: hypothetical protein A2381_15275 [Bdellovibrionales bacterium RIFOXYB1_FULL_37_110]|nr:MAG: hypothetical protein A2381_15275 [Bdellovibrionales bacterium RIFOXYB1_FULL_37_110]
MSHYWRFNSQDSHADVCEDYGVEQLGVTRIRFAYLKFGDLILSIDDDNRPAYNLVVYVLLKEDKVIWEVEGVRYISSKESAVYVDSAVHVKNREAETNG